MWPKFSDIRLKFRKNLERNLNQETDPTGESNPGPLRKSEK